MEFIPFATIDGESISLKQALDYLRSSGAFPTLIGSILRQHSLRKELKSRTELTIDTLKLDQAIMDFRIQNELLASGSFQQWLKTNNLTYEEFQEPFIFGLKVEQVKNEVTEPDIEKFFAEKKPFFDRVVLSRIILEDRELAQKLKHQLLADKGEFEKLARAHSIANDSVANGMMGPVSRGTLPNALKTAVELASPGEIVGPLEIEGNYGLFRVEQFLDASLEEEGLKEELQNELFEQWLQEKLQVMEIKLEVE